MLFGPTGVGKTAIIEKVFADTAEIISADSLQVYRGLNIGSAKPGTAILNHLPHHLIDILNIDQSFDVGDFCHLCEICMHDILARGKLPVISGGTAFYMKTWLMGLPRTPAIDLKIREKVKKQWLKAGNDEIHQALSIIDPESAERIPSGDRYRMLRALEVYEQCRKPLSIFKIPDKPRDDIDYLLIGLRRTREDLHRRIEERVESMISAGLEMEAKYLYSLGATDLDPGMKGIGYKEWLGTKENPSPSLEEVKKLIIQNTRRYAKRQMTFFTKLPDVVWIDAGDEGKTADEISKIITEFEISCFIP